MDPTVQASVGVIVPTVAIANRIRCVSARIPPTRFCDFHKVEPSCEIPRFGRIHGGLNNYGNHYACCYIHKSVAALETLFPHYSFASTMVTSTEAVSMDFRECGTPAVR